MGYRTKTYIAADWVEDKDAVDQLGIWNKSDFWSLSLPDAHELTQARDKSLKCSIKKSLDKRLDISKKFVLIVGSKTKDLRSGSCQYCPSYKSGTKSCSRGYSVDMRSYIEYECDKAKLAESDGKMKIIVLYNYASVDKSKCPDSIKNLGTHVAMCLYNSGAYSWNYPDVKNAIG